MDGGNMELLFVFIFLVAAFIELAFWVLIFKLVIYVIKRAIRRNNYEAFKQNTISENSVNLAREYADITLNDLVKFKSKTSSIYNENFVDVSNNKLDLFNVSDINTLKDYFYDIFYRFEKALNNLDYQQLKHLSTDQIYENFYTGIELDINNGNKRIIDSVEKKKVIIYELDSTIAKQVVSTLIEIRYINYTVNNEGKLIKGQKEPITEKFIVKFRKDFKQNNIVNCPNCGAPVSNDDTKCSYCESKINNKNDFKISSIQRIV